jgi:hypothetical protein
VARGHVQHLKKKLKELEQANGWDAWRRTPVGEAAIEWQRAIGDQRRFLEQAKGVGLRAGHDLRRQAKRAAARQRPLQERFEELARPERDRIEAELPRAERRATELEGEQKAYDRFSRDHPEVFRRLKSLEKKIARADYELAVERQGLDGIAAEHPERKRSRDRQRALDLDRGLDLGL